MSQPASSRRCWCSLSESTRGGDGDIAARAHVEPIVMWQPECHSWREEVLAMPQHLLKLHSLLSSTLPHSGHSLAGATSQHTSRSGILDDHAHPRALEDQHRYHGCNHPQGCSYMCHTRWQGNGSSRAHLVSPAQSAHRSGNCRARASVTVTRAMHRRSDLGSWMSFWIFSMRSYICGILFQCVALRGLPRALSSSTTSS